MRRITLLLLVFCPALALVAPPAGATSGTMIITTDTTLTEDQAGSIVIDADDITLDCAGFTVSGPDLERGISVDGHSGVTVKDCLVTGFYHGIVVINGSGNTVRGNTTYANDASGIVIQDGATDTRVIGNRSDDNALWGFQLGVGAGNTYRNNETSGNLGGFGWDRGSNDLLVGNIARGNVGVGFGMSHSAHMTFRGNIARGNGGDGFVLGRSSRNVLADNVSIANGARGLWLWRAERNLITGNTARGNGVGLGMKKSSGNVLKNNKFIDSGPDGWGVWVADSSNHNRLAHNVARQNDYEGFAVVGSSDNELIHNISNGSDYEGISLYFGAEYNVVRGNVIRGNAGSGVGVVQSSHNSIIDNRSMNNNKMKDDDQGGISLIEGSSFNVVLRNAACNNGNVDGYDDRSGVGNVWRANDFCTSEI